MQKFLRTLTLMALLLVPWVTQAQGNCTPISTFPVTYGFEADEGFSTTVTSASACTTNVFNACWRNEQTSYNGTANSGDGRIWHIYGGTNATYHHTGTNALMLPDKGSSSAGVSTTMLVFPAMNFTSANGYTVSFWIQRNGTNTTNPEGFKMYVSPTDTIGPDAVELGHYSRNRTMAYPVVESANGWYQYETSPITLTGTVYLIFEGQSYYGSSTYIDDIKIEEILPCAKPADPTFVSATTTSATLSWTNGDAGQNAWQIAYSTNASFSPDDDGVTIVDVTSNPGTITGLTPATVYYAYVRANCGADGYSNWSNDVCQFATACDAITSYPWSTNFDSFTGSTSGTTNNLPVCWSYINTTTYSSYKGYPIIYNSSSTSNSGTNHLRLQSYYSTTADPQDQYAILPNMANLAGKQITLMARGNNTSATFKIGLMSNPADVSTFVEIATQDNLTTTYQEFNYLIPTDATANHVAIMMPASTSGTKGVYIDDITIDTPPSCIKPSDLAYSNVTAHGATISWTSDASAWQIRLNGDDENIISVTTNPYTLTGLTPETSYTVDVRSDCGGGDVSVWSTSTVNFTTTIACPAPTALAATLTPGNGTVATLNWTSDASAFVVEYGTSSDFAGAAQLNVNGATTANLTGLTPETQYYARVKAVCGGEDGESSWSSVTSFKPSNNFSLTVYDGTATSNYVPAYVFYWDDFSRSQVVIPAADLAAMDGGSITSISFYTTSSNIPYTSVATADMYLMEVNYTEISAYEPKTADAIVYSGTFDFVSADNGGMVTIEFDTPYEYNGGNLLIAIENTTDAGYKNISFYGQTVTGASISGSHGSNPASAPANQRNFIPKTTFTYEPPVVSACARPGAITVTDVQAHTATVEWTAGGEETSWNVYLNNVAVSNNPVTTPTYTFTGLDGETQYTVSIYSVCGSQTSEQSRDKNFTTTIACQAPTDLAAALTPGNGSIATLSWTENGTATAWTLEYGTDSEFTGTTTTNVNGTPSIALTGLTPETMLYARVKAVCGGIDGESQWSETITFTPTNAYSITVNDGTATNEFVPIYGYYVDNISKSQFIIPAASLQAMQYGTITKLTFYTSNQSSNVNWGNAQFEVYVTETSETSVSTLVDWTTMTLVKNAGSLSISDNVMEVTFDAPYQYTGGNLMIGVLETTSGSWVRSYWYGVEATGASMGGYGTSISQQNFLPKTTINYNPGEAPSCPKPMQLAVNYTGGTTAEVSWTSDATAWNLDVNGTITAITENPYTLTGLNLATTYEVKLQANCGGSNGTSEWTNPVSFTTDICMPADQCELTFEVTDSYGDGWNNAHINVTDVATNAEIAQIAAVNHNLSSTSTTDTIILSVCNGRAIQFSWTTGSYDGETSYIIKDINGDEIYSGAGAMSAPVNYTVSCVVSNCKTPTNLTASEVGKTTAQLSWTENGQSTAWVVAYKVAGADNFTEVNASTNPFTLTGLTTETNYVVKVRPVCEDNVIKWSLEQSFTTPVACPAPTDIYTVGGFTKANDGTYSVDLTWTGYGESYTVVATPTEGSAITVNSNTTSATLTGLVYGQTYEVAFTANCGTDGVSNPTTGNLYVGYCTPNWTNLDGSVDVAFGMGAEVVNNQNTVSAAPGYGDYTAMVGAIPASLDCEVSLTYNHQYTYGTVIWVDWNNNLVFEDSEIVYTGTSAGGTGTNTLVASFNIPSTTPVGNYRMRIGGADSYYDSFVSGTATDAHSPCPSTSWGITHDYTLHVLDVPNCQNVTELTASNITANSAVLTWTDTQNDNTTTYTVKNGDEVVATGITAKTYTLANLASNTDYTFSVFANCIGADALAVNVSFTTPQLPATVPYTADFEDATDNSQWTMINGHNAWYVGDAASMTGNGLYISNDNGVSNAYTNGSQTVSCAYRTVNFTEAGWYSIAYDWKANGESTWDYLRVALAPADAAMPNAYNHNYYNTLPEGWIALDGGKLNLSSDWNNAKNAFQIAAAGQYNLVLMWSNDNSGGSNPPAAVDNIAITGKVAFEPIDLTAENITSTAATLTWTRDTRNNNTETYTIMNGETVVETGVNANNYQVAITPNAANVFTVFAVNSNEQSEAEAVSVRVNEYATQTGKMVKLHYTYDFSSVAAEPAVSFYYGMGATRAAEAALTPTSNYAYGLDFTNTSSLNWAVDGPVTVVFVNHNANDINFSSAEVSHLCPTVVTTPAVVDQTANGTYTWITPEGTEHVYNNLRTADLAANENGDVVATYTDTVRNAGQCDSVINTLHLVLHPAFTIAVDTQFCEGTTFVVGEGTADETPFTASAVTPVLLHTVNGADSVINLTLQMNPAPVAYINNKVNSSVSGHCDGFDMVLNARSNMEGVTFAWGDTEATDATRTVNPSGNVTYTLVAIDPSTECHSIDTAKLTVSTIAVPELTVSADVEAICVGQGSATLTVTDANNIDGVTFRWYNADNNAVAGTGATLTVSPTATTAYYVKAEGTCLVQSDPITITVNELPVVSVATSTNVLCAGAELTISATEGFAQYSWSNGANTAEATFAATTTGAYTVTVTDQNGCVSEATTASVTVNPVYELNDVQSVCFTQNPYTWGQQTITANGNYDQTFQTINGCDSLVHLTFTFEQMSVYNTYREVCQKSNVTWGTTTYENIMEGTTLTYELVAGDIDPNTNQSLECPAQYNLVLTVNPVVESSFEHVVCDSYLWNLTGETYTESGAYLDTLQTVKGCDSVVTMNLTVNYQQAGDTTAVECDQFNWGRTGETYTASGDYTTHILTTNGCDSTLTMHLTVNTRTYHEGFWRECDAKTYTWMDGEVYDLDVELEDSVQYITGVNGNGCKEIALLHLDMNYVSDTLNWVADTACDSYFIDVITCDGDTVREYFSESDSIQRRTRNPQTGRDRISRIVLTINHSEHQTEVMTACVPFNWDVTEADDNIMSDTVISQELETEAGCPLVKVLRFTAKYPTINDTLVTLCQNDSWTDGNNVDYYASNYELGENEPVVWSYVAKGNAVGCDSTERVIFTVNPVYGNLTDTLTFCESDFANGPIVHFNPNNANDSVTLDIPIEGLNQVVYTNTMTAYWHTAAGCDSIVSIVYIVNPTRTEEVEIQSCYTYTWESGNDSTYTESGDYTWQTSTEAGCDSTVILHLTVADTIVGEVVTEACGEYEYDGVIYRESMTFSEYSGIASTTCDSVTNFVFNLTPRVMKDVYIVANAPYTWENGRTYTANTDGVYYDATPVDGCDSILVLHLTMQEPITLCENALPYTTSYDVTLPDENPVYSTDFEDGLEGMDNTGWYTTNVYAYAQWTAGHSMFAVTESATNTLVMPAIEVSAGSELTFDAAGFDNSMSNPNPTNMVVKVSTNGQNFEIIDEEELPSRQWENFTIGLGQYAGQTIYIAFERAAGNDQAMCIDNVNVSGKVNNVYTEEIDGINYVINYTVNYNSSEIVTVEACDSYEWKGTVYTVSDMYSFDTVNVNGCDSTVILDLTVNYHSDSVLTITNCDSYTWSGIEFTESIDTTIVGLTNEAGCDSTATLHLTINVNAGTADTVVACDSYDWEWSEDTIFLSGDYSANYTDLNGCQGVHTLNLTVNVSTENDLDTIVDAASTYYNGTYYADINEANGGQPYEFDVLFENGNAKSCDSVDHVTLYVTRGVVIDTNINICGDYPWINEHTYTWIDADERAAHGNALYKDITDANNPVYIHSGENPTKIIRKANGVADTTYVLWLNMIEAKYFTYDLGTILLSQHQSTYEVNPAGDTNIHEGDVVDAQNIDFSGYYAAQKDTAISVEVEHSSNWYCKYVVTYTANLVWNYDTLDDVYVCNGVNSYEWIIGNDTINETLTGDTTTFTETFAQGTANEMVNTITVVRNAAIVVVDTTATACDQFVWYGDTLTTTGDHTHNFEVEHNGILCDSLVTLHLTINNSNTGDTTAVVCDQFVWYGDTITASSSKTHVFTNVVNCDSVVTLNLTINYSNTGVDTLVACDSALWNGTWYYADNNTATKTETNAANCDSVVTLNLTVHHNNGIADTIANCLTYTWKVPNYTSAGVATDSISYTYNGAAQGGDKTITFNDVNGCEGTATLHLTIYDTVHTVTEQYEYGSGYTFLGHFYTPRLDGTDSTYVIPHVVTDTNGCETVDTLTLHVSQYVYTYINKVECGSYTWTADENGNGHIYRVLTAEEAEANPTAAYFDVTANQAVANMQQYDPEDGNIYVLNLTLNTPIVTVIDTVNVPMSQLADDSTYTIGTRVINCAAAVKAGQTMVITQDFSMDAEGHGPFTACDSIVRYNINVIYNYFTDDTVTLCASDSYTLPTNAVKTVTPGDDSTFIYTLNAGTDTEEVHTVVVTNNAYTGNPVADTVTACDSYTWTSGNGTNYTTSGNYTWNDEANCLIDTLKLTINNSNAATDPHVACDSYTWINGTTYTASNNTDTVMLTNVDDCDSVVTLNLTINESNTGDTTAVACDSFNWYEHTNITASVDTLTHVFTNEAGCDSVVTLNLTINVSNTGIDSVNACDSVQWNNTWYYASNNTATKTINNVAGCDSVVTLNLTVNYTQYTAEEYWFGEGSYRYTGIHTAATGHMYMPGDYTVIETIAGAAEGGCDIIDTITLHVGNYFTKTIAARSCNNYTWDRNNTTYVRLTDEQAAQYEGALYFDQTNNMPVYANPTDTVVIENNYDSIYMLDLTLDAIITRDTAISFPVSLGNLTFAGQTYNYSVANDDAGRLFEGNTDYDTIHLNAVQYCDSIINLTVNVIKNYSKADSADICMSQSTYTWREHSISTVPVNVDNDTVYYIYDVVENEDSLLTTVEYIAVTQHAYTYVTERREACDSFEWYNGRMFYESTTGATAFVTDEFGCQQSVTLSLTINHATSSSVTEVACDGYEWTLSNGEVVSPKYTVSGVYTKNYNSYISEEDQGCPSTDTLYLTINNSVNVEMDVASCGTYTWMNGDDTVGTYNASGVYTHTFENTTTNSCDSVVTINLTVNEIPAIVLDAPDEHVCDTFFWIGQTWNGIAMVDTVFDTITETAYSLTAYAYNENGCKIEHFISAIYIDKSNGHTDAVACDSYLWTANDSTYTESGEYTYTSTTANVCGNPVYTLSLTINKNSGHAEDTAICNKSLPVGGFEWHGYYYTEDAVAYYDYYDANDCPSQDTLNLTVGNARTFGRVEITNCGPYTWDLTGETFTEDVEASAVMEGANVGGCDSVVYLYLTILNAPVVDTFATICDNQPINWRGYEMVEEGEQSVSFKLENGCDSTITLHLTVNHTAETAVAGNVCLGSGFIGYNFNIAAEEMAEVSEYTFVDSLTTVNGCDSVVTLTVTVNHVFESTLNEVACETYTWDPNDVTYNESGVYTHTLNAVNDCDSVVTLNLTINHATNGEEEATACNRYEWNGQTYTQTGVYTFDTVNVNGCDSVVTLNLTVNYSNNYEFSDVACDSYLWNGATYNQTGDYTYAGTNVDGCDSVVTLHLTINNSTASSEDVTACDSYEWHGETYTESGEYFFNTTNSVECDSVVTLNLTINNSNSETVTMTACVSYEWNDSVYTETGEYTFNTVNVNGCDSTAILVLTILQPMDELYTDTACDSYVWNINGETYTETGVYSAEITGKNGCPATADLLLTINVSSEGAEEAIACDSYEWNGETYTQSGVYTFNTTNAAGCDSVATLTLTINSSNSEAIAMTACGSYEWNGENYTQSGVYTFDTTNAAGCDSVATLNLTINTASASTEVDTVCDSYPWNGTIYTESGEYTYTTNNAAGCDSVVTLTLTVNHSTTETLDTAVCGSFTWTDGDGETYSTTGIHTFNTTNAEGCNLQKTLLLTINQPITIQVNQTVCDAYEWNGQNYTTTGNYTATFTAANGCDSIVTLALTVNNSNTGSETATACDSYSWNGTIYNQSGAYNYTTTNVAGCDSVVTLNLTINNSSSSETTVASCGSYTWNNVVYSQSGNYSYTTTNLAGCDSVAYLFLTVNQSTIVDPISVEACVSYTWNGNTYTQSGVYYDTTANAQGCDNVAALVLTISQPFNTTVYQTACDSYEWNNTNYTTSGNYDHTYTATNGCDSVVTLALTINQSKTTTFADNTCDVYTWNGQTYTTSGQYEQTLTARNGCDSVVTLNLTVLEPINTSATESACESYIWSVNGQTYTQSGTYTANITGTNGCPATATLALTVNNAINTSSVAEACNSYTWTDGDGQTYTQSGDYTRSIIDVHGCVATDTLHLTINGSTSETVNIDACDSYTWSNGNGNTYTEDGIYTYNTTNEHGCSHVITLVLNVNQSVTVDTSLTVTGSYTWHGETYTESGTYIYTGTAANGCDSTTILQLTVQPAITYYTVTLTSANSGMGTVSEGGVFAEGTAFTAVATANDGYEFVNWTNEAGEVVSQLAEYSFTVTSDVNLTANFVYMPIYFQVNAQVYTVMHNADGTNDTVIGEHGQVLGTGEYESNATVTLTAVADSGYHFVCWSNGYNTATITFTVTNDMNLIAYFEQDQATPQAIAETDMSNVVIFSVDTKIIVRGVEGNDVYVFDVNGRMLDHKLNAADEVEFRMAATGVYLVKVGNAPAKRVLVVR